VTVPLALKIDFDAPLPWRRLQRALTPAPGRALCGAPARSPRDGALRWLDLWPQQHCCAAGARAEAEAEAEA
jgi:hypothetical protein